jgi:hypothetical protein
MAKEVQSVDMHLAECTPGISSRWLRRPSAIDLHSSQSTQHQPRVGAATPFVQGGREVFCCAWDDLTPSFPFRSGCIGVHSRLLSEVVTMQGGMG